MGAKKRRRRLSDFERRAVYAPQSVYLHRAKGWRYIPIHSFADDDLAVLGDAGIKSGDCKAVHAYWEAFGDVYFVEVEALGTQLKGALLSARRERDDDRRVTHAKLVAKLSVDSVTRTDFERVMLAFWEAGIVGEPKQRLRLSDSMTPLPASSFA